MEGSYSLEMVIRSGRKREFLALIRGTVIAKPKDLMPRNNIKGCRIQTWGGVGGLLTSFQGFESWDEEGVCSSCSGPPCFSSFSDQVAD